MKYEKIRGKSIAECMMKLRSNHGPDTIILGTRELKEQGPFGLWFLSKKKYEIDYMISEKKTSPSTNLLPPFSGLSSRRSELPSNRLHSLYSNTLSRKSLPLEEKGIPESLTSLNQEKKDMNLERSEQTAIQQDTQGESSPASGLHKIPPIPQSLKNDLLEFEKPSLNMSLPQKYAKNSHLKCIQSILEHSYLSPAFASDFLRQLDDRMSNNEKEEYTRVEEQTIKQLAEMIQTVPFQLPVKGECRAFLLMGPSGAGKTTSLAKLAARFHLAEKREVSIYSLDHYRLAATEQLKTYARVMDIPFYAPMNSEEFCELLRRDGAEIFLIDTAGAGFREIKRLQKLKELIATCAKEVQLERHLVLSADSSPYLLGKIVPSYHQIGFDKFILTKVDQVDFIGAFIEIADKFKRPFSCLMDGQDVPGSICEAEPEKMARIALGLEKTMLI